MIIGFEGLPGSGKSYDAINKVIDNLRAGRVVYTNLEGTDEREHQEHIKVHAGLDDYQFSQQFHFLDKRDEKEFWKVAKPGSIIFIDEAHKIFNSRDWQSPQNRACADWCSTHRHQGYDVFFLTQNIEKLDSQIRTLVQWTYRYRKVDFLGKKGEKAYLVYPFSGDDTKKPIAKPKKKFYDTKIFACYKSYVTKDMKELGVMRHINILNHPVFYAIIPMFLIFLYFFTKSGFAHGELIPGQHAAAEKFKVASALVPHSAPTGSAVALQPVHRGIVRQKKIVSPVVVAAAAGPVKYVITGKAASPGHASLFYYKSVEDLDDVDVRPKEILQFKLDGICKCNSRAAVDAGYEFKL
jgi:zona occludens toxin (predicted ATPase)